MTTLTRPRGHVYRPNKWLIIALCLYTSCRLQSQTPRLENLSIFFLPLMVFYVVAGLALIFCFLKYLLNSLISTGYVVESFGTNVSDLFYLSKKHELLWKRFQEENIFL